jgi:hypothetical protein
MREITVRYESGWSGMFTQPFEVGVRHLVVAVCEGSQESLTRLAKEKVIYRSDSPENAYNPLSFSNRVFHCTMGVLETAGFIIPVIPFVAFALDRTCKPLYPKGCYELRTHMQEGGTMDEYDSAYAEGLETSTQLRRNPFDSGAELDPFYKEASWTKKTETEDVSA